MAMHAVNMLGGEYWLHSPMPHTLRTTIWMRSWVVIIISFWGLGISHLEGEA